MFESYSEVPPSNSVPWTDNLLRLPGGVLMTEAGSVVEGLPEMPYTSLPENINPGTENLEEGAQTPIPITSYTALGHLSVDPNLMLPPHSLPLQQAATVNRLVLWHS